MTRTVAAGLVGAALLVGGTAVATQVDSSSSTATTTTTTTSSALGAPPVEVLTQDETSVTLYYGPSQPGPFTPSNPKPRSLKISWPPAKDDQHPTGLTYTVMKNGKTINSGLVNNFITVGFTTAIRSFRFCVRTVNVTGKGSPLGCTTFSGQ